MKRLAAILLAAVPVALEAPGFAHGGGYPPPLPDLVPPGGGDDTRDGGETTPDPVLLPPRLPGLPPARPPGPTPARPRGGWTFGPGSSGGSARGRATSSGFPWAAGPGAPGAAAPGGGLGGPDLTAWSLWWDHNKEPYLDLKAHVHAGAVATGSDGFFLGRGEVRDGAESARPTAEQIRGTVVPALLAALERETNNDVVTGCLIALAKIGDPPDAAGPSKLAPVFARYLSDANQEIRETATIALGILAHETSIPMLMALLADMREGRKLVGASGVDDRTRAFAAYGLGLIGASTDEEWARREVLRALVEAFAENDTRSRDLPVACVIAIGLVPLETIEAPGAKEGGSAAPFASRIGQLELLLGVLRDEKEDFLVRAHCPAALVRLLAGLPEEPRGAWRARIAADLRARARERSREPREVVQSAVLALGTLAADAAEGAGDRAIRDALRAVPRDVGDQQARHYAMIAMARAGGAAADEASAFLLDHLERGDASIQPWAGLAIGFLTRDLQRSEAHGETVRDLSDALRAALREEKDPARLGAYAVAVGITGDVASTETLLAKLEAIRDDEARGHIAVALGLMNAREAIEPIQRIVRESRYRPELLRQAAIGLGLMRDPRLVPDLVAMLGEAKSVATQASIASALGFIGDRRSIDPLVAMLRNERVTPTARAFAAVALGIVGDKEPLPWNAKIATDLNYGAATPTLFDPWSGTGILDIL